MRPADHETRPITSDDAATIRALYDDHATALFEHLARRVGRELAEELLSETFHEAIRSWDRYDPSLGSQVGWLYGIATNRVRRHWRIESRRLRSQIRASATVSTNIDPLLHVADTVANGIDAVTDSERLADAIDLLDPVDRDLLVLAGWDRMNSRAIGEVLGLSPVAVRSRLHRVRSRLRDAISPEPSTGPRRPTTDTDREAPR